MANEEPEVLMPSDDRAAGEFVSQPAKLLRIAAMIRELLEEVRKSSPDEAGRKRLRSIYDKSLTSLKDGLSPDLQKELETLTLPLDGTSSESEIRLAQDQLVGLLGRVVHGSAGAPGRRARRMVPRHSGRAVGATRASACRPRGDAPSWSTARRTRGARRRA